ncbi:MAG: hypothetical protein Sylvanvirus35_4 [Sylvanvirus sp.]|uniref:Uncharacterized protein n=1 Tax=Sylvanvirus sp. TaxID=2487774 RepID=A0A3G5AJ59_9VIRU|nr:MAG: hypothetical protein Sylvanvirus35_4 [Sylvanvirus sp.]
MKDESSFSKVSAKAIDGPILIDHYDSVTDASHDDCDRSQSITITA